MNSLSATGAIEAALIVKCEGCIKGVEFAEPVWVLGVIINLAECAGPDPIASSILSIPTFANVFASRCVFFARLDLSRHGLCARKQQGHTNLELKWHEERERESRSM